MERQRTMYSKYKNSKRSVGIGVQEKLRWNCVVPREWKIRIWTDKV